MSKISAGAKFRQAVKDESPLQVVGTITAYAARMAERTGFKAVYLSGGGVAANSLGMPDLGISTMEDVLTDARRITAVCSLPLMVDIDTGWGSAFNIASASEAGGSATGDALQIALSQLASAHHKIEDLYKECAVLKEQLAMDRMKVDMADKMRELSIKKAFLEAKQKTPLEVATLCAEHAKLQDYVLALEASWADWGQQADKNYENTK